MSVTDAFILSGIIGAIVLAFVIHFTYRYVTKLVVKMYYVIPKSRFDDALRAAIDDGSYIFTLMSVDAASQYRSQRSHLKIVKDGEADEDK